MHNHSHNQTTFAPDIRHAGQILEEQAQQIADEAVLHPVERNITVESLHEFMLAEGHEHIVILDTKVQGIEDHPLSVRNPYGYEVTFPDGRFLTVIDHHVSDPELGGKISTGNLVDRYEQERGSFPSNAKFVITHKDCDSLISYLRASGYLQLDPAFSSAVLSADHTFEQNPVGDVAQALEGDIIPGKCVVRSELAFSIRNVGLFLQGKALESDAAELLEARLRQREGWQSKLGGFTHLENGVAFIDIGKVDNDPCPEFLTALLPETSLILVFHEWKDGGGGIRTVVRTLRGVAGEGHFNLDEESLGMKKVIPGWGGRSGAGSDRRSPIALPDSPAVLAQKLDSNIGELLQARGEDPFSDMKLS